jgi:toxin ParE1/3/4
VPAELHKGAHFLADYTEIVTNLASLNPDAAERFCAAVEHALALLAAHPLLGTKAAFRRTPHVRKWVIQPFSNYLLFYEARTEGILLIRLLHGARDLQPLIPRG